MPTVLRVPRHEARAPSASTGAAVSVPSAKIGDELVLAMADDVEREPSSELVISRRFTPVPEYDHVTPLPHRSDPR